MTPALSTPPPVFSSSVHPALEMWLAFVVISVLSKGKVKASHTRYRALYRQSAPQVTVSHPPGGRLPLLSARPAVTSPASEHHRPLAGTKLYCLMTEAHRCEQLARGCYAASPRAGFELATCWSQAQTPYPLHHRATYVLSIISIGPRGALSNRLYEAYLN